MLDILTFILYNNKCQEMLVRKLENRYPWAQWWNKIQRFSTNNFKKVANFLKNLLTLKTEYVIINNVKKQNNFIKES